MWSRAIHTFFAWGREENLPCTVQKLCHRVVMHQMVQLKWLWRWSDNRPTFSSTSWRKVAGWDKPSAVIILHIIVHFYIAPGYTIVLSLGGVLQLMNFAPTKCIQDVWHFLVRVFWVFRRELQKVHHSGHVASGWQKTMSNDVHIIAVSGNAQLFVTRSVRRSPKPWDMHGIASVEACSWSLGYASLGSQLVLAKRMSAPPVLSLPEVKPSDLDAEAVMNPPPTPVEQEDGPQPVRPAAVAAPPISSVLASDAVAGELETLMEVSAEAGIPLSVGLDVPSAPREPTSTPRQCQPALNPALLQATQGPLYLLLECTSVEVQVMLMRPTSQQSRQESWHSSNTSMILTLCTFRMATLIALNCTSTSLKKKVMKVQQLMLHLTMFSSVCVFLIALLSLN